MKLNASIITDNSIAVIIDGQSYTISAEHPSYQEVVELLAEEPVDAEAILSKINIGKAVEDYFESNIRVTNGEVYYNDKLVDNYCTNKAVQFMREGSPYKYLLRFFERLKANSSWYSIEQAYPFLERNNMPITPDGFVIGFKGINNDWTDRQTGTLDYRVGQKVSMPRNEVEDNPDEACGPGLHVGSLEYARSWGPKVVLVKVDPADIVSVPKAESDSKMRTCGFEVIGEHIDTSQGFTSAHWPDRDEPVCRYCDEYESECSCEEPDYNSFSTEEKLSYNAKRQRRNAQGKFC